MGIVLKEYLGEIMRMSDRTTVAPLPNKIEFYKAEIASSYEVSPELRGAMVSAAKRRLKAEAIIHFLYQVAVDLDLDMTPAMAQRLVRAWIGRGVDRSALAAVFGIPGRTAAAKTPDLVQVDTLAETYRELALTEVERVLDSLKHEV